MNHPARVCSVVTFFIVYLSLSMCVAALADNRDGSEFLKGG